MQRCRNAEYVSAKLGVTTSALNRWVRDEVDSTVTPFVAIEDLDGKVTSRGWTDDLIVRIRAWRSRCLGLDEEAAAKYWAVVDAQFAHKPRTGKKKVPDGQEVLFNLSA